MLNNNRKQTRFDVLEYSTILQYKAVL